MLRQYRIKNFQKTIRIKYKDAFGNTNVWEADQHDLITRILSITNSYVEQGFNLTARQLYYQLVARDIIPNAMRVYKRVCDLVVDLRYVGQMDWSAIEDRGRVPSKHPEWDNIRELINTTLNLYRLPRWKDQEYYVELYCEKQALESILKPITNKYHIYFGVNKGYSSASTMYDIAKRMDDKIYDNKKCIILYLGDHDPSGLDMVRDVQKRICEFLGLNAEDNDYFNTVQIALNNEQIQFYSPPHNPAKIKDPRAKWYIQEHGNKSWELDALEPKVLMGIADVAISKYIDIDKYNKWIKQEKEEAKKLKKFGESLKQE